LKALEFIRKNPDLIQDKTTLWLKTIGHEKKVHNSQMDVVIELWKSQMIE